MTLQTIRSRGAAAVRALLAPSGGAPPGDLPRTGAPRAVLLGAVSAVLLAAPRPAAAQTPAVATPAVQTSPARAPRALSLDDAVRLAERQSEAVRIAEAGALRARGQFLQARSQILPQLNATGAYQKQLQNQFQALQRSVPAAAPDPARPVTLCTPELPAGATAAERTAALAQARTCPASDGGLGAAFRAFASPNNIILGLSGSQVLFAGGRVSAGLQAATAARRAADIAIGAARAQVTLDVAQAYYDAALSDRLVAIAESSLVQTERAFRQTAVARRWATSASSTCCAPASRATTSARCSSSRAPRATSRTRGCASCSTCRSTSRWR
jgi:outer membrane protein TolC